MNPLDKIFAETVNEVRRLILSSNDYDLNSEVLSEKLEERYTVPEFKYEGEKIIGEIEEIPMAQFLLETNTGGAFNPNSTGQKVPIFRKVTGSSKVFNFLAKNSMLPVSNKFAAYSDGGKIGFSYVGYAPQIKGNEAASNIIREESNAKFEEAIHLLDRPNDQILKFNTDLVSIIKDTIRGEQTRRKGDDDARNALR